MIISKELMAAIRAVCKTARKTRVAYNVYEEEQKAVARLLASNPAVRRDVKKALSLRKQAASLYAKAERFTSKHGLRSDGTMPGYTETDKTRFAAAGGKIKPAPASPPHAESIIAQLAGATDAQGKAIIASLGIKW